MRRKLCEKNLEYQAAVEVLMAAFGKTPHGSTVTWSQYDKVSPFKHDTQPGKTVLKNFRKAIWEDRRLRLFCHLRRGLYFPTRIEMVTDYHEWRMGRGRRQVLRGHRDVVAQPTEELSDHYKKVRANGIAASAFASKAAARARNAIKVATKPSKSLPRRPVKEGME